MGFLEDLGETLSYQDSKQFQEKLKKDGIQQFLYLSQKYLKYNYYDMHEKILTKKNNETVDKHIDDQLSSCDSDSSNSKVIYWGDEIETHLIKFDHQNQKVMIQPNQKPLKQKLQEHQDLPFEVHAEYGAWMLETVPKKAYPTICRYGDLISNIKTRTREIKKLLENDEYSLSIPSFPLLGVGNDYYVPVSDRSEEENQSDKQFINKVTQSNYIDDRLINPHPRFPTLTENIRNRRQEKVNIQIPIYKDVNTVQGDEPFKDMIYMDAMAFGMGSSCLQTTFSAIDFKHARWLYDQLSIISPMFLALTAGSPIFKGKLADIDTRWDIIAASVDDRSPEERDIKSEKYLPKSRYESISKYISDDKRNLEQYNDYNFPVNEELIEYGKQVSKEIGVEFDENYWQHLGFLFQREALVVFKEDIEADNQKQTSQFENIQSTNWNSVRLKLPPSFQSHIGWRVEFRTTEVNLTDDENAAISMLVHILVRFLYEDCFKLNLYIPMSLSEQNFRKSRNRDALLKEKFFFRTNIQDDGPPVIKEMTIFEIFFGKKEFNYPGIYGVYENCCKEWDSSCKAFCCHAHVNYVFDYIRDKCSGKIKTLASFQRDFVLNHPEYKQDSIINQKIAYDLCKKLVDIQHGVVQDPNFPKIFPEEVFNKQQGDQLDFSNIEPEQNQQQQENEQKNILEEKIQQIQQEIKVGNQ